MSGSGTDILAREIGDRILEQLRAAAPAKELYTQREAAEFLACSEAQIRNFAENGKLPLVKIDSRPRFRRRDLLRLVEQSVE